MIGPQEQQILIKAQTLLKAGQHTHALNFLNEKIQSGQAVEHCLRLMLQIKISLGHTQQCPALFEQLIRIKPKEAYYYNELATFQAATGDLSGAIKTHERFLEVSPSSADTWFNLAIAQKNAGRFTEALKSYDKALALNVQQPEEVWLNKAVIQSDHMLKPTDAEGSLEKALQCNPGYLPALFNLGNLYEELGKRQQAKTQYDRILAIDPGHAEALARLANVTDKKDKDQKTLIDRISVAASSQGLSDTSRSGLYFSLGKLLDANASYDAAFEAYSQANQLARASGSIYSRQNQKALTDHLIATFSQAWFEKIAPVSDASPLFICGMFRSGSTLTEQILAAHPDVAAGGELDFFPRLVTTELKPFPHTMANISHNTLVHYANRYMATLERLLSGGRTTTDKRPDNFLYLGLIKSLFPKARIIHTVRHPLDNCLSVYFLQLANQMGYASDLLDTAHYYTEHLRLMAHWKALFPGDILEFNYDSFINDPQQNLHKLLEFCALPWNEGCLEFHKQDSLVKTASYWQVRQPLYNSSSGRWRNYERHLAPLSDFLARADVDL